MQKSFKYLLLCACALFFTALSLTSCDGKVDVSVMKNGAVSVNVEGNIGGTFRDMMESADGVGGIDSEGIKKELVDLGFTDVNVFNKNDFVKISFIDVKRDSPLFKLGIISEKNKDLSVSITPENFLKLYDISGEELQRILDLFISPVLNDEVMSEEDYVDTINVYYGKEAGKEIDESIVRFKVTNAAGGTKKKSIFVKKILCGEKIYF